MIALLLSPLGKIAAVGALVLALLGAGALWLHSHDNAVRAAWQAQADKAIAAAQEAAQAHEIAALQAQAAHDQARVAASEALRRQTHAVPPSAACVGSAPLRALHDGLLNPSRPRATP
jgi:hypothetical protein